jgi:hypothetical protein
MKGSIVKCLADLVRSSFGEDKWNEIVTLSGENPNAPIRAIADFEDRTVFRMIDNTCKVLHLTRQQACDAFGDYWVNTFAPKVYGAYYHRFGDAKQFIIGMSQVHKTVTKNIANARPPEFTFEEPDENTLIVTYISTRNMLDFYIGLVKGVGKYFSAPIGIEKLSPDRVKLTFG